MKIKNVRAHQPPTPGSPADWRTQLGQIIVEIETDGDFKGIGVGGGGAASIHVVETVLRDLLVGRNASNVEQIHREMCGHTVFYGRSGLVVMAISGVDLALWDLRGKAAGQPIARLLNPNVDLSRTIPTYATVWDDMATQKAIDDGHAAVKLHVERFGARPDPELLRELVSRVRQTLGDDGILMIDAFARWDVDSTLRVADAVAEFNVAWLEEPIPPNRYDDYAKLVERCPVAIAGGEHEYFVAGFERLIDDRLHAVLQPDINWCGGMTTLVEVYRLAKQAGLRVCPHRGCEPFALHAIAALDNEPLAESPRIWFNCLNRAPIIDGGVIQVEDRPGFGVDVA